MKALGTAALAGAVGLWRSRSGTILLALSVALDPARPAWKPGDPFGGMFAAKEKGTH